MKWGEVSVKWYGTAHNWLRVCTKSEETVTWNKKCNQGLTFEDTNKKIQDRLKERLNHDDG